MSLILDALNKSEQERTDRDHAANIHSVHRSSPEENRKLHHRRWFWEFIGVLVILVLVYFYSELKSKETVVPLIESASTELTPTPVEARPKVIADKPLPNPVAEPLNRPVLKLPASDAASSEAISQLYKQPAAVEDTSAIKEQDPLPVQEGIELQEEVQLQEKAQAKEPELVSTVDDEPPVDQNAQWIAIPLISELPPTTSSGIASIDFSEHVYAGEEGGSFVNINGELQREGDLVAPDLRLVKIFEYGVILDYKGTQFRLLPLSGWVNM